MPSPASSAANHLLSQSTGGMQATQESPATCCCGQDHCAYLRHNDTALKGLEQDLQSAAQIGQALLARHEAYMVDAENERRKMGADIDKLEQEKQRLEDSNARTIQENHDLLNQLEVLNNQYSHANSQISSLNETLQSTLKELDRLTVLAAQSSNLEAQLVSMEEEQALLYHNVAYKEEGEKSAIQRWKQAERTVCALQEQVERIEREAAEERERHAEVVARFERRRLVEQELENAAGRLKGAAAKATGKENGGGSVVSSFVKDILQDNANLQMGIVELREMLMGSNEEVESLREQMMQHQPVQVALEAKDTPICLDEELARTPTNDILPDFHVHHHYHAAPKTESSREKHPGMRRPRKRRQATAPGLRTPSVGSQSPHVPNAHRRRLSPISTAATIMAQTSVSIPPPPQFSHGHQWSMSQAPSSTAASSIPSSPTFDVADDVLGSSRPTTPGSTVLGSPELCSQHYKRGSDVSVRSNLSSGIPKNSNPSILSVLQDQGDARQTLADQSTILEESEGSLCSRPSTKDTYKEYESPVPTRRILHRASSHESLMSTHVLDVPKIRLKPSQRLISGPRASLSTSTASTAPIAMATSATAHRSKAPPKGYDSSNSYNRLLSAGTTPSNLPPNSKPAVPTSGNTLGKRVGGWITGKWGMAPENSTRSRSSQSNMKEVKASSSGKAINALKAQVGDQRGSMSIMKNEPVQVNTSLLQESLQEETKNTVRQEGQKEIKISKDPSLPLKQEVGKRKAKERPLSTHVEAIHVDGALLTESLGDL